MQRESLFHQCSQWVGAKPVGDIKQRLESPLITGCAVTDSEIMKASVDTHGQAGLSRTKYTKEIFTSISVRQFKKGELFVAYNR